MPPIQHRGTAHTVPLGRAVAAITAAALSTTIFAAGANGTISSHATTGIVISAVTTSKFGTILTSGRTLYVLKPSRVACSTTCRRYWPEVLLAKGAVQATAGHGVSATKLGTLRRAGGGVQVTYAGRALYWFFGDAGPGQVNGNVTDTWGTWSVVVIKAPSPRATTTTSSPPTTTTVKPTTTTTSPAKPVTTTSSSPTTTTTASSGGGGVGF